MDIQSMGGKVVQIGEVMIPAANVQVEGFPTTIGGTEYPIYFEILFEQGVNWCVDSSTTESDGEVAVEQYTHGNCVTHIWVVNGWEEFLNSYLAKKDALETMGHNLAQRMFG